jgi:NADPH-dependent 2,4-dienoyl-CoA reductase/sulfur reductase-like enzyme
LTFDRLILATGARERFLPFPGWTLPGVMGAGGLQALVKGGLPISGSRVVVAGSGPLLLAVAAGLAQKGAEIEGIFEQAPLVRLARFGSTLVAHPGKLIEGAGYRWATRGSPYRTGWWVTRALGRTRLEAVVATDGKTQREFECDYLACGFHLVPNPEVARLLGCRIEDGYVAVNALQETSEPGVYCVGEPTGIGGLEKALVEGEIAGLAAAGRGPETERLISAQRRAQRFVRQLDKAFALRSELRTLATLETIVCRCEDVTRGEIEDCVDGRAARLHNRCGMGPCQGRICGPATEFLFGWSAVSVRPPVFPARVSTLAGDVGCGLTGSESAPCKMT